MTLNRTCNLVRDLMQIGVTTCSPETTIASLSKLFLEKDLEAVIVQNPEDGHALGMVTQSDLVNAYSMNSTRELTVSEIMQENFDQILPDIPVITASQMMLDNKVRSYFKMHHSGGIMYPAAYLSYKIILRYLAAQEESDLQGLIVQSERKTPIDLFVEKRDAARRGTLKQREE